MTRPFAFPFAHALKTALAVLALGACSGGDGPQIPTLATSTGAITTMATVATTVAAAPSVKITDATGRAVKNVLVRWRVIIGGGKVVNDSVRTSPSGEASSGGWTLGTLAGIQTLQASADGVPPVTFTADAAAGPVTRLTRLSPESQQAVVNTTVPLAPSVRAEDAFGNAVAGVSVIFSVVTGGGAIIGETQSTDAQGVATAGGWRLGTIAGLQVARATSSGGALAAFTAIALPGAPANLIKIAGDGQRGLSSVAIAIAPGVRVVDAFDNPVGNVPVTFTPGPNSGTVIMGIVNTDPANGTAFVGAWILGGAEQQTLTATSSAIPGKSVTFSATVVVSLFDIVVRYVGLAPTDRQRQAFDRAVVRWRAVILGTSGTSRVVAPAGSCGRDWLPAIDTVVTNLIVFAKVGPIDGVNGVLGNANACAFHSASGLTVLGTMLFDSEDLDRLEGNGLVDAVITHEMGHALGIGTRWINRGLLQDAGTPDPIFIGPSAREQFLNIGGATYSGRPVPVENTGGAGTALSHWRESVFRNELMTGFVNLGANPLSRVTVGSLADLGYVISYAGAESFTISSSLLDARPAILLPLGDDIAPVPASGGVHVFPASSTAPASFTAPSMGHSSAPRRTP